MLFFPTACYPFTPPIWRWSFRLLTHRLFFLVLLLLLHVCLVHFFDNEWWACGRWNSETSSSQFLNLLTFGLWGKIGRLTHYAFDAVLSMSRPTITIPTSFCYANTAKRQEKLTHFFFLSSLDYPRGNETIDWLNVSTVLLAASQPVHPSFFLPWAWGVFFHCSSGARSGGNSCYLCRWEQTRANENIRFLSLQSQRRSHIQRQEQRDDEMGWPVFGCWRVGNGSVNGRCGIKRLVQPHSISGRHRCRKRRRRRRHSARNSDLQRCAIILVVVAGLYIRRSVDPWRLEIGRFEAFVSVFWFRMSTIWNDAGDVVYIPATYETRNGVRIFFLLFFCCFFSG